MTGDVTPFDYELGIWGEEEVSSGDRSFAGFRLRTALHGLPEEGRLLDVGCGAGRVLRGLQRDRPLLFIVGTDISRAVLALDVLEHVADPDALLAEIRRVLVPGGVVHLHVPCEGDALCPWRWMPGSRGERALKRRYGGHLQHLRRSDVRDLLRRKGFEVVRSCYSLHFVGNVLDVAAFVAIALAIRRRRGKGVVATGTLMAKAARRGEHAGLKDVLWALIQLSDRFLWGEARLLSRVPSRSVHVTARRSGE